MYIGDICTAPADVVCTSTNPNLDLMLGTGGAIREAGGWTIQEECNAIIEIEHQRTGKRCLMMGSAVLTGAGELPFKGVIHCVAIDPFHDSSVDIIKACVRNALKEAAGVATKVETIAMPVFASGHGRFDFEESLKAMTEALGECPDSAVKRVCIVVRRPPHGVLAQQHLERWFGPIEVERQAR